MRYNHYWRMLEDPLKRIQVVDQHGVLNAVLSLAVPSVLQFLLPVPMGSVVFARVWLAHVNGKKLKSLFLEAFVESVEGRDLAHEGGSGDASKFQQDMLFAAELRQANLFSLQIA